MMPFNQGHALLIGVGTHQHHPRLDVPITVADAEAVEQVLRDKACGYPAEQVHLVSNGGASKTGILSALDALAGRVSADDTVFLFYCGHGALGTDGNYYLVSHDARLQNGRVVAGTGVAEGELLQKLRTIEAQRVLMLFNACHSGNISPTLDVGQEALEAGNPDEDAATALLGTGQGRIIIVACREQQVSYIGDGPTTIFTQALVDGLRGKGINGNNGYISAFSLYERIYEVVHETVKDRYNTVQEPELTVLRGVGPFAVSLYRGAETLGNFAAAEPLPTGMAVREVSVDKSIRRFKQRVDTGGGAYVGGNVNVQSGDFIGRDKVVHGDEVRGDKVGGDKVRGDKVGGVNIGNVTGGIHDSIISGRDVKHATITVGGRPTPADKQPSIDELTGLLAEIRQGLAAITSQQELLQEISSAAPYTVQGADQSIKDATEQVKPDIKPDEAASVQQKLNESVTLLTTILDGAKAVAAKTGEIAQAVQPLVEQLTPLVTKIGVAALWVGKLWLSG